MIPFLSIVVPVFNGERTIGRCIGSLLAGCRSTSAQIEIVAVDDGSTDSTGGILDGLSRDCPFLRVVHRRNGGVSAARNTGIENSSGEHLIFVDADDWLEESFFGYLAEDLRPSDARLPVFSVVVEDAKGRHQDLLLDGRFGKTDFLRNLARYRSSHLLTCSLWNKVYSRRIVAANGLRFPAGVRCGEDFIFNMKYFRHVDEFVTIGRPFYHYVLNDGSATHRLHPDYHRDLLAMQAALEEFLKGSGLAPEEQDRLVDRIITGHWMFAVSTCVDSAADEEQKREVLQEWRRSLPDDRLAKIRRAHSMYRHPLRFAEDPLAFSLALKYVRLRKSISRIRHRLMGR